MRIRSDVRPDHSNKDGSAIERLLIEKLAAAILELADRGQDEGTCGSFTKVASTPDTGNEIMRPRSARERDRWVWRNPAKRGRGDYHDCVIPNPSFRGSKKTIDLVMCRLAAFADDSARLLGRRQGLKEDRYGNAGNPPLRHSNQRPSNESDVTGAGKGLASNQ
jgi:hypothetical protein